MAKRSRNYKAEYARRIERGLAQGLSRSQSRGHARATEAYIKSRAARPLTEEKVSAALRRLYDGVSLTAAAKEAQISPERLKRALIEKKIGLKQGSRWIVTDRKARQVQIIVDGRSKEITVRTFSEASRIGFYHNRVRQFLNTQDVSFLSEFEGETVTDIHGKSWPLDTDPNTLIRFALKDEPAFHEIYQIVAI